MDRKVDVHVTGTPGQMMQCPSMYRRFNHHVLSMYCVRMRFSLGYSLMHRDLCLSLVRLFLPIVYASISGIRKLIVEIHGIDATLMGHWIVGHVRTMMRSVIFQSNFSMGECILRRVLMVPCAVLLRDRVMSSRIIALLGSVRGRVDCLGGAF